MLSMLKYKQRYFASSSANKAIYVYFWTERVRSHSITVHYGNQVNVAVAVLPSYNRLHSTIFGSLLY